MANNPIVFAMANPDPEIKYQLAVKTETILLWQLDEVTLLIK